MIFSWVYFLAIQAIVVIVFYLKRKVRESFELSRIFSTRIHFLFINLSVFILCYWYNTERQLFCNPVPWAATLIILFCGAFLLFPFVPKNSKLRFPVILITGLGLFMVPYFLLFARQEYLIFLLLNIPIFLIIHFLVKYVNRKFETNVFSSLYFYPAVVLTPFLLAYQLFLFVKSLRPRQKWLFAFAPALCLVIVIVTTVKIHKIIHRIENMDTNIDKPILETGNVFERYLAELTLGAHWKYHTELVLVDGWRPPYHDPILVCANKILNPFSKFDQGTDLENATMLYKSTFPENRTEFSCKCATHERLFDLN